MLISTRVLTYTRASQVLFNHTFKDIIFFLIHSVLLQPKKDEGVTPSDDTKVFKVCTYWISHLALHQLAYVQVYNAQDLHTSLSSPRGQALHLSHILKHRGSGTQYPNTKSKNIKRLKTQYLAIWKIWKILIAPVTEIN